jgi:hypothetical protein
MNPPHLTRRRQDHLTPGNPRRFGRDGLVLHHSIPGSTGVGPSQLRRYHQRWQHNRDWLSAVDVHSLRQRRWWNPPAGGETPRLPWPPCRKWLGTGASLRQCRGDGTTRDPSALQCSHLARFGQREPALSAATRGRLSPVAVSWNRFAVDRLRSRQAGSDSLPIAPGRCKLKSTRGRWTSLRCTLTSIGCHLTSFHCQPAATRIQTTRTAAS